MTTEKRSKESIELLRVVEKVASWLKLDADKLFEPIVPRPRYQKKARFDKWNHKESKLIIG